MLSSSSYARLENKLNLLISEVRAGKREGSIISTQDFHAKAQSEQETWDSLRRELEDVGVSPEAINEKRAFIVRWFQEAVAEGRLEEDATSGDEESLLKIGDSASVLERALHSEPNNQPIEQQEMRIGKINQSNTIMVPRLSPAKTEPRAQLSKSSPSSSEKEKARLRFSYLRSRMKGKDLSLMDAAEADDEKLTTYLIKKGVNVHAVDDYGMTALHRAAMRAHKGVVEVLLDNTAYVNARTVAEKQTALMIACRSYANEPRLYAEVATLLLKRGAQWDIEDSEGKSALIIAVERGNWLMVETLLERGIHPDPTTWRGQTTALLAATLTGKNSMVRLLVGHGADLNRTFAPDKATIFSRLILQGGPISTLKLLIELGVDIDDWAGASRMTALMHATQIRHLTIVEFLLHSGANVNAKSSDGLTALGLAMGRHSRVSTKDVEWQQDMDIISMLIKAGASTKPLKTRRRPVWEWNERSDPQEFPCIKDPERLEALLSLLRGYCNVEYLLLNRSGDVVGTGGHKPWR